MGDATFGPNGELLSYSLENDRLIMWNSTLALEGPGTGGYRFGPSVGSEIDGTRGIQWNVSIPDVPSRTFLRLQDYDENLIIAVYESKTGSATGYPEYPATGTDYAFPAQLTPDSNGNYPDSIVPLWTKARDNIEGRIFHASNIDDGVYVRHDTSLMTIYAYDAHTGNELWKTQPTSESGWAYFTYQIHIAYGKVIETSYDGYVRAWNVEDGSLAWEYYFGDAGSETVYGSYPTYSGFRIADGKLYVTADEHSPDSVLWRGGKLWVIDIETGEEVWSISGMLRHGAIADGYYTVLNNYDGKVYTFGKGQSATTVSAPDIAVELGESFTITGTVTDQSPGQTGTPAISDEDMSAWMEYIHMQKNIPGDAKGVEVLLDAIDPNGNYIQIGQVTSDITGSFGFTWTPEVPGLYQIIATFAGSDSYGSSVASTYLSAIEAPQPTPAPTSTPAPMTDTYVVGTGVAVIVAIAVALLLLLRKK
ncbi:MAG: outer membrane protein assembly factor BamB family protein [Promethearchaeota archaeon]